MSPFHRALAATAVPAWFLAGLVLASQDEGIDGVATALPADDLLFELVKYGPAAVIGEPDCRSAMPAHEGVLPDADIVATLARIKHAWPPEERRWQAEVDRTARGVEASGTEREGTLERLFR